MATPDSERISLLIGGQVHSDWLSYSVDSDLLTPADAWTVSLSLEFGRVPDIVRSGASAEIRLRNDPVMVGRIDKVASRTSKGGVSLAISGRDLAGQLLDCSAPIFSAQLLTLQEVVARIVRPLLPGVRIRIDAENALPRGKVSVEPGDSAWDALQHAAEANGLWPWFEPDGTLVVGGPDYGKPAAATLIQRLPPNAGGNNVLSLDLDDEIADSYSEVTVLAQTHGGGMGRQANHAVKGSWKDPSVGFDRPRIVVDHESDTVKHAQERARKLVLDSRLRRWTLTAVVPGHRINAPGLPGHGQPWAPGMRIHVIDETRGLDATCFLIARRFTGGRQSPPVTVLTLKEDGVWIVAAHPHKRRHRRGKNGELKVWDIANSPEAGT